MTTARRKKREPAKVNQDDKIPPKRHQRSLSTNKNDEEMKDTEPIEAMTFRPQDSDED